MSAMQLGFTLPNHLCACLMECLPAHEWLDMDYRLVGKCVQEAARNHSQKTPRLSVHLIHPDYAINLGDAPRLLGGRARWWFHALHRLAKHPGVTEAERGRLLRRAERIGEWLGVSVIEVLGHLEEGDGATT